MAIFTPRLAVLREDATITTGGHFFPFIPISLSASVDPPLVLLSDGVTFVDNHNGTATLSDGAVVVRDLTSNTGGLPCHCEKRRKETPPRRILVCSAFAGVGFGVLRTTAINSCRARGGIVELPERERVPCSKI
jgi:hypothetical protein